MRDPIPIYVHLRRAKDLIDRGFGNRAPNLPSRTPQRTADEFANPTTPQGVDDNLTTLKQILEAARR